MRTVTKWVCWGVVGLLPVLVLALAIGYLLMRNTVEPLNGQATLLELEAPVSIVKDQHAIPHIEADNFLDAVRALGWAHAGERLWQMEMLRMAGQGRLAEMLGGQALPADRFLRSLQMASASKASFLKLNSRTQKVLEAYVSGVNRWISHDRGPMEPSLPVEFIVLGHKPQKWESWHSVLVLKVMALTLDANMEEEIGRLALAGRQFSPAMIEEMYPAHDRDLPPDLPNLAQIYGFGEQPRTAENNHDSGALVKLAKAPWRLSMPASNNWAISGNRTDSGLPLLANDPHLGLTAPGTFYLAHLSWKEDGKTHNLVGGTLPGLPFVLSGRNDRVAWGVTTTYLDSQDIFLEQINPANAQEYRTPEGFERFEVEEATLKVSGAEDEKLRLSKTRHGPVLPEGYKRLGELLPSGHVAAVSWIALGSDDVTLDALYEMGRSQNVQQFLQAARKAIAPMQSVVVADIHNNIGLFAAGRIPKRADDNLIAGRAPVPGWIAKYDWQGFVDPAENPIILNPPNGAVASANSNWLPKNYPHLITYDWGEAFRQQRVEDLFVNSNEKQSFHSMKAGQADRYSLALVKFRDEILRVLPQGVRLDAEILSGLRSWNGHMDAASPFPLILTSWHKNLQEGMLRDDLKEDFEIAEAGKITRILAMLRSTGARNWCDDVDTRGLETCGDLVFATGKKTLDELREQYGSDWQDWRWGTAHMTLHEHRPFTQVGALARFFTIRREMDGGSYTLLRNASKFDGDEPLAGIHGSALRTIYDFSDLENSKFMISTGQSGNVFSQHYDDLADRWASLQYVTIKTKSYRDEAKGVFTLIPIQ